MKKSYALYGVTELLFVLSLCFVMSLSPSVYAATFTVNSTADTVDASPGDGICADESGNCSLRAAIMESNALAGADIIDVPGGTYTLSIEGRNEDASVAGDLDVTDDLTINGAGEADTIIDADEIDRVLHIHDSITEISDVTVTGGNDGGGDAGGILNSGTATFINCTISGNRGRIAGGLTNFGTATITKCTINNNDGSDGSGGLTNFGAATLTDSTISGNVSTGFGDVGGILNHGTATLSNCTISNNDGGNGDGGIENPGSMSMNNCTVSGNVGQEGSGIENRGPLSSKNSIVANNIAGRDCLGEITSLDYNLDSDGTCNLTQPNDLPNTDPLIGPLADNGGSTETHALLVGSPAIDAGELVCTDLGGAPLTTDQRGEPRPVDGNSDSIFACDIGAFELQVEPPPLVDLSGTIEAPDRTDICAMVLASGQYTFSCNPPGVFSLTGLPQETDGTVKRQIYADGFLPKIDTLLDSTNETVVMTRLGDCPNYNIPYEPAFVPGSSGKEIYIAGEVFLQNSVTPICAVVLANGQAMFSCDGTGRYDLNIPLDINGQFKLQVYADGFAPSIRTFDEFKTTNIVRMARAVECQ